MGGWKVPPKAKIYEALTAVADGKVKLKGGETAEVLSSDGTKTYIVEWSADFGQITSNDNASHWHGRSCRAADDHRRAKRRREPYRKNAVRIQLCKIFPGKAARPETDPCQREASEFNIFSILGQGWRDGLIFDGRRSGEEMEELMW